MFFKVFSLLFSDIVLKNLRHNKSSVYIYYFSINTIMKVIKWFSKLSNLLIFIFKFIMRYSARLCFLFLFIFILFWLKILLKIFIYFSVFEVSEKLFKSLSIADIENLKPKNFSKKDSFLQKFQKFKIVFQKIVDKNDFLSKDHYH